ncbi:MAG TPA: TauD/TfdA family dioxygenase [Acidimicrobiia bacterium]|nr:TauD/TfdA family dioxygenase [Acidimicrobiia bacterium]
MPRPGSDRTPLDDAAVWQPHDIADPSEWTVELTDAERAEIVAATRRAVDAGATTEMMDRDALVLPTIGARVADWSAALTEARGFLLLRRFPIDLLDEAETELAYCGFGAQLGTPVGQDADASLLGHVRDEGVDPSDPSARLYRTRARQDFHTDGSDLVGLLCLLGARSGGERRIVSSGAVYNEMLRRRPDLVDVLYEPLPWDRHNEQSAGEAPYFSLPVFSDVDGVPRIFYLGWYIRDSQRHPSAPRLTNEQLEAMDLLESVANDPAFYLEMEFAPGDVQLLNNGRILHSREAYEDHGDPARRRHLLRLWLSAHRFASVEGLLRAGIPRRA